MMVLISARKQLAGTKYMLGMFSFSGILHCFLMVYFMNRSVCRKKIHAIDWRRISGPKPLKRSATSPLFWFLLTLLR